MWSKMQRLFYTQPKPKLNQLTLRLESFLIEYGKFSVCGSPTTFEVNDHACEKIKKHINHLVRSPEKNPNISMQLILQGYWNGKTIHQEFSNLDTLNIYLQDHAMINQSDKSYERKGPRQ